MRYSLLLYVFSLCTVYGYSQNTFFKIVGNATQQKTYSIIPASDSGYIWIGSTNQQGSLNQEDVGFVKFNANGEVEWARSIGGSSRDFARSVIVTTDGGYAILASTTSFGAGGKDILLIKTNPDGTIQWARTYGGFAEERAFVIQQLPDNGFLVGGSSVTNSNGVQDAFLIRTDDMGNPVWERKFGGFNTDNCFSIALAPNGDILFTGSQGSFGPGDFAYWIIRLTADGNVVWIKTYGGNNGEDHSRIIKAHPDGGYLVFGHTTSFGAGGWDYLLLKISENGAVEWARTYGGPGLDFTGSVTERANGNYLLMGHSTSFATDGSKLLAVEVTPEGEMVWSKIYSEGQEQTLPFGIDFGAAETPDGGLLIAGVNENNLIGSQDIALIQTNAIGESCGAQTVTPQVTQPTIVQNDLSIPFQTGVSSNFITGFNNLDQFEEITICNPPIAQFEASDLDICQGSCIDLTDQSLNSPTSWQWYIDGSTTPIVSQNLMDLCFENTGTVPITLVVTNEFGSDSTTQVVTVTSLPTVNLGPDQVVCEGSVLTLDATTGLGSTYLWQDNSTNPILLVNSSGQYSVEVTEENCPAVSDTVNILFQPQVQFDLGNDTIICEGNSLVLDLSGLQNVTIEWSDGSTQPTLSISEEGSYGVSVQNPYCPAVIDEIAVTYFSNTSISLGPDTLLCEGEQLVLDLSYLDDADIFWQDGSDTPVYNISVPGSYSVQIALDDCPEITDTIAVDFSPAIGVDLGVDTALCEGQFLFYDFRDSSNWEIAWQDGSTSSFYTIENEGIYWVNAQSGACTASDTLVVEIMETPSFFFLPGDTIICEGEPLVVDLSTAIPTTFLWQDGDTSRVKAIVQPGNYSVTATDACQSQTGTFSVSIDNCDCPLFVPNVFSPNDDGFNDRFRPETDCIQIQKYTIQIFDRWGELVFESEQLTQGWDGKFRSRLMPSGVYAYVSHH